MRGAVHLLRIFVAWLAACLGGAPVVAIGAFTHGFRDSAPEVEHLGGLAIVTLIAAAYIVVLSFLPALAAIVVAEMTGLRRLWPHIIGGALAGLFAIAIVWLSATGDVHEISVVVVSGAVAGVIYWAIAGRHAGYWRPMPAGA
jgi:hypothetical protein